MRIKEIISENEQLDETKMAALNHPKHGNVVWERDPSGDSILQVATGKRWSGNAQQIAKVWAALKSETENHGQPLKIPLPNRPRVPAVQESASAGSTSAASIASVPNPNVAIGKSRGDKSYTGSPGKSGTAAPKTPKVTQLKTSSGTATNALDMKTNVFGGAVAKR